MYLGKRRDELAEFRKMKFTPPFFWMILLGVAFAGGATAAQAAALNLAVPGASSAAENLGHIFLPAQIPI
jgi:hypothetical protein